MPGRNNTSLNINRGNKVLLKKMLVNWKSIIENDKSMLADPKLRQIIQEVKDYSNMGTSVSYAREGKLYSKILTDVQKYSKDLNSKMSKSNDPKLMQSLSIMDDLNVYFESSKDGFLEKPIFDEHQITFHDGDILRGKDNGGPSGRLVKYKDTPLFSHDPSMEDVALGNVKNGCINAVLGNLVQKDPDFIRDSMSDNKDGTVTVRLYQAVQPVDQGEKPQNHVVYKPVYVTVDKSMPQEAQNQGALWVRIYEKALAASGMFYGDKDDLKRRPVPGNVGDLFHKYMNLPKTEWPTHQECPWLIDEKGDLHPWQPSYKHLDEIANPSNVMECIQGEKGRSNVNKLDYDYKQIQKYKTRQVLGTVYNEVIKSKMEKGAEHKRFFNIANARCKNNPQVFMENLKLCAGLVSSMPKKDVEKYLKNIKYDKNGKITSFPITPEQKMLEHMEEEITSRVDKALQHGKLSECKTLLKDAAVSAEEKVKHDKDPKIAELANGTNGESIKKITDSLLRYGNDVYSGLTAYTKEQDAIFNDISNHVKKGKAVIAGTKLKANMEIANDKQADGLKSGFSYSVVGVAKEVHDGKEYKYVLIMNPDKEKSEPIYNYSKNPPQPEGMKKGGSDGVAKVELNHFCDSFGELSVTGKEAPTILLPENMLTRNITSQYTNFIEHFSEQLEKNTKSIKDPVLKEAFTDLHKALKEKAVEMSGNLGKSMKNVSFKDVQEKAKACKELLEMADKADVKQIKMMNRIDNLSQMYESGLKNPKALILGTLEKAMEKDNILDAYAENNCAKTVINSHNDLIALKEGLEGLNSRFVKPSKEYIRMQKSLNHLDKLMKDAKPGTIPRKEYTKALNDLFLSASEYLNYKDLQRGKVNGVIKAASDIERDRIEVATTVKNYAEARQQLMKHQNLRDALKLKTYRQLTDLTSSAKLSDKNREFRQIVNSDTLNDILDKASDQNIERILKSNEAAKAFADRVDLQINQTKERSPIERYKNEALRTLNSKDYTFSKRECLARVFLAEAMRNENPDMKMGQLRKFERKYLSYILSSNTLEKCIMEQDMSKLDKKAGLNLVGKYGDSFKNEMKSIRILEAKKVEAKVMQDKNIEMAVHMKNTEDFKEKVQDMKEKAMDKMDETIEKHGDKIKNVVEKVMEDEGIEMGKF